MKVTTAAVSEPGARAHNDDAFGDAELVAGRAVVVADGAGGHRGGAVASKLVIESVMLRLATAPRWDEETLLAAVDVASRAVHQRQRESPGMGQMSSTAVVLCLDPDAATARWTHLGDSRLLHVRRGIVVQLTRDHSVTQSFVDAGMPLPDGSGPDRSVLYAAVGAEGDTRAALGLMQDLADGDAFLLCTDGVWDTVPPHQIERLFALSGSVDEWVAAIADAVRAAGKSHQDNYTAVGVWIGSPEEITVIQA